MLFNFKNANCLHAGHGNTGLNYYMGGAILCKTVNEKYLGITIYADRKFLNNAELQLLRVARFLE